MPNILFSLLFRLYAQAEGAIWKERDGDIRNRLNGDEKPIQITMKKLLKFAAPILILALLFASCDDRGSAPSGGSGLTVTIDLPARTDYPASASGFSVAMPSKDGLAYASSVTYTAAAGESPATLVAAGFPSPKGGLAPYAIVSFESTAFGLMATGQIALTGVISMGPSSPVESSAFNTVPVITVTVQPEAAGAFPMPTAASDYALTFKSDDSSAIFTPNSDQVKITQGKDAVTTEPQADAVKAQAVITVPQSFALGNLSAGEEYSVTMAGWSSDGNDYTAEAGSLTYNLGSNIPVSMAASQIEYGSISISLPESFQSKAILGEDDEPATIKMSDVGTVSYSIKSSDGKEYSGTVSETAVKVPYGTYSVSISFSYGEIAFAADASASVTVSSSEAATATIDGDAVQAQVADITVSFGTVGAPSSWPTLASAYAVTYAEIKDGEAGAPVAYPVKNALSSQGFTIASSGLKVGSAYEVVVSFAGSDHDYRAVGTTGALVSIDSTSPAASTANAVTAYFGAPVTATVSGSAALSGFSGFSGTAAEDGTSFSVTLPNGMEGSITATLSSTDVSFSGKVTGQAEAFEDAEFSITGTVAIQDAGAYSVNGTFSGEYEEGSLAISEVEGTATISSYAINVTDQSVTAAGAGSSGVQALASGSITLTEANLDSTSAESISSLSIKVEFKASQKASVTGTIALAEGKTLPGTITFDQGVVGEGLSGIGDITSVAIATASGTGTSLTTIATFTVTAEAEG